MTEWKEYKLGEVISFGNGKERPKEKGDIPVYGGNGILDYTNKYNYEGETIVLGRVGAYCGSVYYSNTPIWVSDNALVAKPKEGHNTKFFYYYLTHIKLNDYAEGSSHPLITQTLLNSIDIRIPINEIEQCKIASILTSMDDKIDLLRRENATLEAMAETLFRQWFVEEAKEEWEEKPLKEVVDIAIGRTPPRKESKWFSTNPNDIKWLSIKDMGGDSVFLFNTSEYLTKEAVEVFSIPIIPKSTVVLSFKMTVGRVGITTEDMLSNEAIAHLKFKDDTPFSKEYLYLFLRNYRYDTLGTTSSIVTAINSAMIKNLKIAVPDADIMERFKNQAQPIFDKIYSNQEQINTLVQTRDGLLPRLMSNEIAL